MFTFEHTRKTSDIDLLSTAPPAAGQSKPTGCPRDENADTRIERDRLTWDARFGVNTLG